VQWAAYSWFACDVIAAMLEDYNKKLAKASFVYGTNMAAMSLDSLGNDCKPRIRNLISRSCLCRLPICLILASDTRLDVILRNVIL
jgi:hypothetical protein